MTRRSLRTSRGLRLLVAVLALGAAFGVTSAMLALAGTGAIQKKVPPRQAAKATQAIPGKNAQAVTTSRAAWAGIASKVVPLVPGDNATTVAGLSLAAGTYEVKVAGSLWTTKGTGVQNVGCHLVIGKDDYGDAYLAVDQNSIDQASYAIVGAAKLTAQSTANLVCAVGKTSTEDISTQANIVATQLG